MALEDLYRVMITNEVEHRMLWLVGYVLAQVGGKVTIPFEALLHMPPDLVLVKSEALDSMSITFELRDGHGRPWPGTELAQLDVSKLG